MTGILFITFIRGMNNYLTVTNFISRIYSVAAVLYLQFVIHVMLFCMVNMFCTFTLVFLKYVCRD